MNTSNSRLVSYYTISEEKSALAGDMVEIIQYRDSYPLINIDEGCAIDSTGDQIKRLPVERVIKRSAIGYKEKYIAIDPELLEMLTCREREKIRDLKKKVDAFSIEKHQLAKKINNFIKSPWYKRIIRAIKGSLI